MQRSFLLFRLNKVLRNTSSPLTSNFSHHGEVKVLMMIVCVMKNVCQVCRFPNETQSTNGSQTFEKCSVVDIAFSS